MQTSATLIFPHQLFQNHPGLQGGRMVYLVEEWLFFRQYNFHKKKLVLHRASMKFYESWLSEHGYQVKYVATNAAENDCRLLVAIMASQGIQHIYIADVADDWLLQRMTNACNKHGVQLHILSSPNFLNVPENVGQLVDKRGKYFQTNFYVGERKRLNLLMEKDGKPEGGQWTFDSDNRKKFPKNELLPTYNLPPDNDFLKEARVYVDQHFPDNYGQTQGECLFGVTFQDAAAWLNEFLNKRFHQFGIYEDAIVANQVMLFHSCLTPMLNVGLLNPEQIVQQAIEVGKQLGVPLNSIEGFIRQIIGWREFMRLVYEREGAKQRTRNFWRFKRRIPQSFWTGQTGILPIDITITKVIRDGYCHHIERLMVLGNFMLLCEFDPNEVYRWFMELFIDAYDWVMVPNVYGMSQFADGGMMVTKPYISGSNYLMKMSDYPKGDWQATWDGLFWRFMSKHREVLASNPRLGMLISTFDKMPLEKQQLHLNEAERYLASLGSN